MILAIFRNGNEVTPLNMLGMVICLSGIFAHVLRKGRCFLKVKHSLVILTKFEFSRQELDTKLLENDTFQSIPNQK